MRIPVGKLHHITLKFGVVDKLHPTGHNGCDWSGRFGGKVYAPESGDMRYEWQPRLGGNVLIIKGKTGEHRLAHFSTMVKRFGRVKEGDYLGQMGQTGLATGVHLHQGLKINGRYVDPMVYITPKKVDNSDMPTPKDVDDYSKAFRRRPATSAEKANYSKRSWRYLIDNFFRSYKGGVAKVIAAKDKVISDQKKAIDKLVAENSKPGREAIVADIKPEAPVEKPSLLKRLLNAIFGG